jgi:FAD-linked oxidoreductase
MTANSAPLWRNWSGRLTGPGEILHPRDTEELARLLATRRGLRPAGAGHSFTPLVSDASAIIDFSAWQDQEVRVSGEVAQAPGPIALHVLTRSLAAQGWALPNQGDIDRQSLAGAVSTGTHGTGRSLGAFPTFVRGFTLVTPDGKIRHASAESDPDLFEAGRLSLGALGVLTRIEFSVLPAYRLIEQVRCAPLAQVLEAWSDLQRANRHVEFWVFPYTDQVILKTLNLTQDPLDRLGKSGDDDGLMEALSQVTQAMPLLGRLAQRQLVRLVRPTQRVGPAHVIFPSARNVRFNEMEIHVPEEAGPAALLASLAAVRKAQHAVAFPFEFRSVAGDGVWLSPFFGGARTSIAVHQYWRADPDPLFRLVEPILMDHGGRPHWGKVHTQTAARLRNLYPRWEAFQAVRQRIDPEGRMMSHSLRTLFNEA